MTQFLCIICSKIRNKVQKNHNNKEENGEEQESEPNDEDEHEQLSHLLQRIWPVFCSYFNLASCQWEDILQFYGEKCELPFCPKCRMDVVQLLISHDQLQTILYRIQKLTANISATIVKTSQLIENVHGNPVNENKYKYQHGQRVSSHHKNSKDNQNEQENLENGRQNEWDMLNNNANVDVKLGAKIIENIHNENINTQIRSLRQQITQSYKPQIKLVDIKTPIRLKRNRSKLEMQKNGKNIFVDMGNLLSRKSHCVRPSSKNSNFSNTPSLDHENVNVGDGQNLVEEAENFHWEMRNPMDFCELSEDFECSLCGRQFSHAKGLRYHQRSCIEKRWLSAVDKSGGVTYYYKTYDWPVTISGPDRFSFDHPQCRFVCGSCGHPSGNRTTTAIHIERMHIDPRFVCGVEECRRAFVKQDSLLTHRTNVHSPSNNKKTFKCQIGNCKNIYTTNGHLVTHEQFAHKVFRFMQNAEKEIGGDAAQMDLNSNSEPEQNPHNNNNDNNPNDDQGQPHQESRTETNGPGEEMNLNRLGIQIKKEIVSGNREVNPDFELPLEFHMECPETTLLNLKIEAAQAQRNHPGNDDDDDDDTANENAEVTGQVQLLGMDTNEPSLEEIYNFERLNFEGQESFRCLKCHRCEKREEEIITHAQNQHQQGFFQYARMQSEEMRDLAGEDYEETGQLVIDEPGVGGVGVGLEEDPENSSDSYEERRRKRKQKRKREKEEGKVWTCTQFGCGRVYSSSSGYFAHKATHTGIYFTCPVCQMNRFSRKDSLKRHIKSLHPQFPVESYLFVGKYSSGNKIRGSANIQTNLHKISQSY